MKKHFNKSFLKKLTAFLLLVCMISQSAILPSTSVVYATTILDEHNTKGTTKETNTDQVNTSENKTTDETTAPVTPSDVKDTTTPATPSDVKDTTAPATPSDVKDTTPSNPLTDEVTLPVNPVADDTTSNINSPEDKSIPDTKTDSTVTNKTESIELSIENFPDEIFRNFIALNYDKNKDKQLSPEEIALVENIDVSNKGIRDLTGILYFTNLLYLYCNSNYLTSLDVHTLTQLIVLDCSFNQLTNLDLSKCSSLLSFEGGYNAFTIGLDEKNTFDLSSFKEFDIERATHFTEQLLLNDSVLSLPTDTTFQLTHYRYDVKAPLLKDSYLDVSLLPNNSIKESVALDEESFPDSSFRDYLAKTYDMDQDSYLSVDELNQITHLSIPDLNITSLTGIEYFKNLIYLNFDNNEVSTLDLNALMALREISAINNKLTTIFLQELSNLEELYLNNNQLYALDLSQCSSLITLECNENVFEVDAEQNTVSFSSLEGLDLSRTSNWSTGTMTLDNKLQLDTFPEENKVTYTYQNNAPNDSLDTLTFTMKVNHNPDSNEVKAEDVLPVEATQETITIPEQAPATATADLAAPITYLVAFNSDGGSEIATQTVLSQSKVITPNNPVKAGYLFNGWYLNGTPYDFNSLITTNITLTASWQQVAPSKPTIKSLKNSKKSQMKITLKAVANAAGYEISYSTNKNAKKNAIIVETEKTSITVKNLVKDKTYYVRVRAYQYDSTGEKVYSNYSKIKKVAIKKGLNEVKATNTSATIKNSKLTATDNVWIKGSAKNMVKSSDNNYYLFALTSNQKKIPKGASPLSSTLKATSFQFNINPNLNTSDSLLHSKFVIAVKVKSGYTIISKAKYITNPQFLAEYTYSFPSAASKKGLQINASMLNDVKDLGVKHVAFNIPLDLIIASSSENNHRRGIDYEYNGETYWFRKSMIAAYDSLFRNLERQDIVVSAIVLLGWRDDLTHLITPSAREEGHNYYAFNTSNPAARKQLEATFTFLAERYASGSQNGKIVNWIIGNEVNSFDAWNYAGTSSLSKYAQIYADSYRLAYTALKSVYSNARVYVSLDHYFDGSNSVTFSGKEFLERFDSLLKENGKISWNLAYHPYPSPLTNPRFWKNENGLAQNSVDTPVITMKNISVLTKYIKKQYGKNTRIILSEQGFTSAAPYGEKTQAAAIAYAYYITEFNSMIDSLILSRHVDNIVETRDGLNLGLWSNTPGHVEEAYQKKYAWKVYKYMDTPDSGNVTKFALKIIGFKNWKKAVPGYKANKFKSMPTAN